MNLEREVTKCHRCKVDLFACEIRNDIEWCSECWDILYPNGKGVEVTA